MKKETKFETKKEQGSLGLVRTADEVISRYLQLNPKLRRDLTDFYNRFMGLSNIVFGNEDQQEIAYGIIRERVSRGEDAFPEDPLTGRVREEVTKGKSGFAQLDLEHITEVTSLVHSLNVAAKAETLTQPLAKQAYEILIPYLYGKRAGGNTK